MSSFNPKLPNLELLEYQFKHILIKDPEWNKMFEEKLANTRDFINFDHKYFCINFDIEVFPQIWGSTTTAFDITKNGYPTIGGQAMTKAYTTVIKENFTEVYGVFVDNKLCYIATNPTEKFYEDLKNKNMQSLKYAKELY